MTSWTQSNIPDQSGRVVVITGANSGVGYESAVALAARGARVVMACRSLDKAERARKELARRAPGASVDIVPLDLGSLKSVRAFADHVTACYDRLDVLMNNAGIMIPPYGQTADGFETQFGTNHLGHFALTGLLLPILLRTPHSRIVTVSSIAAMTGRMNFDDLQSEQSYNPNGAYGQSKLANLLFATELERKLETAGADVISVASHPGVAATNLLREGSSLTKFQQRLFKSSISTFALSIEAGAVYQLYAATAPSVRGGEFYGPRYLMRGPIVRVDLPTRAKDLADAARLWEISEQLTGVSYATLSQPAPAYDQLITLAT